MIPRELRKRPRISPVNPAHRVVDDRRLAARAPERGERVPVTSFVEAIVVLDRSSDDLCQNPCDVVARNASGPVRMYFCPSWPGRVSATAAHAAMLVA